ncbi:MAG: tetratricopeptide repeat protein [Treponema sp.]|nr:tetratricopeptide repeat protein [Treponema sp.]
MKDFSKRLLPFVLAALIFPRSFECATAARVGSYYQENPAREALGAAYNAYRSADWPSAVMLFRRALSDPQNESDSALYMLIMAGMNSKSYKAAYADMAYFLQSYPDSEYAPLIKYQQGRSLFFMGEFDKAVLALSDFCHEHPESEMYASALFWIAESFYTGYNFEQARPLYERIVDDFPKDAKAIEAKYRLDAINQRLREEKLLYLLQQTGESYLSSKENYEKALRRYELESAMGVTARAETSDGAAQVDGNESGQEDAKKELVRREIVETPSGSAADYSFIDALARLKKSAAEAQGLLDDEGGAK